MYKVYANNLLDKKEVNYVYSYIYKYTYIFYVDKDLRINQRD